MAANLLHLTANTVMLRYLVGSLKSLKSVSNKWLNFKVEIVKLFSVFDCMFEPIYLKSGCGLISVVGD